MCLLTWCLINEMRVSEVSSEGKGLENAEVCEVWGVVIELFYEAIFLVYSARPLVMK